MNNEIKLVLYDELGTCTQQMLIEAQKRMDTIAPLPKLEDHPHFDQTPIYKIEEPVPPPPKKQNPFCRKCGRTHKQSWCR